MVITVTVRVIVVFACRVRLKASRLNVMGFLESNGTVRYGTVTLMGKIR